MTCFSDVNNQGYRRSTWSLICMSIETQFPNLIKRSVKCLNIGTYANGFISSSEALKSVNVELHKNTDKEQWPKLFSLMVSGRLRSHSQHVLKVS